MPSDENFIPNPFYMIPSNELLPDQDQPRKYLDPVALDELTGPRRRRQRKAVPKAVQTWSENGRQCQILLN